MKRRQFITLLGGAAAWPLAARAQQADRVRRIGALMTQAADDPEGQARLLALAQGLQESGWAIGRNVRIDTRWGEGDAERYRRYAAELVALAPDVILVNGSGALAQVQQATRSTVLVACHATWQHPTRAPVCDPRGFEENAGEKSDSLHRARDRALQF